MNYVHRAPADDVTRGLTEGWTGVWCRTASSAELKPTEGMRESRMGEEWEWEGVGVEGWSSYSPQPRVLKLLGRILTLFIFPFVAVAGYYQ